MDGVNAWDEIIAGLSSTIGGSSSYSLTDLSSLPIQTISQIQNLDLSNVNHSEIFHILVPTLSVHPDSNLPEYLAQQVKKLVEKIHDSGEKVFLIGHSIGGLAVRYYTEGLVDLAPDGTPIPPETMVCGAMTISTPHHSGFEVHSDKNRSDFIRILHVLRLMSSIDNIDISSIDFSQFSLSNQVGTGGVSNHSDDYLISLANLILNGHAPSSFPEVLL